MATLSGPNTVHAQSLAAREIEHVSACAPTPNRKVKDCLAKALPPKLWLAKRPTAQVSLLGNAILAFGPNP